MLRFSSTNINLYQVSVMTPAAVDLSQVDSAVRAQVLERLSASGLSEQVFVGPFYRLFAQGQFSLRYLSAKLSACDAVRGNIFNINCFPLMAQQQAHE